MSVMRRAGSVVGLGALGALVGCTPPPATDFEPVPELVAEETLRIGSLDDPETSLTSIRALEVAPDGRIFTLHNRDRQIRVHAPDGTPLATFGARGDGPGEFQSPWTLSLVDDELRVWDTRSSRITRFDLDGTVLGIETVRLRRSDHPVLRVPRPNWALSDGSVIGEYGVNQTPGWEEVTELAVLRFGLDGQILDTLAIRSLVGRHLILELPKLTEATSAWIPFAYDPLFEVSAARMEAVIVDRAVRPDAPAIGVTKLSIHGDTLWHREYGYDPVAIDPVYVDSFVVALTEQLVRVGFATERAGENAIRETMVIPEHMPPIDRVWLGRDGSVWLALADRDSISTRWLVLRSDGDIYGQVTLPHRFLLRYATLDVAWGVDRDELDVPYIVKFAVRLAVSG